MELSMRQFGRSIVDSDGHRDLESRRVERGSTCVLVASMKKATKVQNRREKEIQADGEEGNLF
jgi:hypothetical protein